MWVYIRSMEKRKTIRDEATKKQILNHLSRVAGQIQGIKRMVEEDAYCIDLLSELSASEKSLESLSMKILENHLYNCVTNSLKEGKSEMIPEVIELIRKYKK